jgi:hypothetical protein
VKIVEVWCVLVEECYVRILTGLEEALLCPLGGYVGFPKKCLTTFDQTTGIKNKAKHLNIFKVTKIFIEQLLRSSCVNMRYRGYSR